KLKKMDKFNRVLHLSRAVQFDCTITIDQLINIPLLNGRFKIKWKFNQPTQDSLPLPPSSATTTTSTTSQQQQLEESTLVELPIKSEPTGATEYHEIKNHSVIFRHAFHCPISINIDKQNILQPSTLTIIIKEEHLNGIGRRIVSRHGSIDIDLSQYTPLINSLPEDINQIHNSSRIEKAKFLLRECKTNASLKLQIQMDYLGGMTPFKIAKSMSGNHNEVIQMSRGMSQPDDVRSLFSVRQTNTCSPSSSIISSGSSQYKHASYQALPPSLSIKKNGAGSSSIFNQPLVKLSASNMDSATNHHDHPQDIISSLADTVIDSIFNSPTPAPSSTTTTTSVKKKFDY
ncbi:hypothetical protein PSTT_05903, partial [Puccinia striiformis]